MLVTSWRPVTIANGESLSGALDITGMEVIALYQAASCEGAAFTFQGSPDGGATYADLQTDAAELSVVKSATAAQVIYLPDAKRIKGPTHVKVRTGTSASATNQTGAQTVWVCLRELGYSG